jgi:glycosyltransferase involved in cell wall biosynthesis
MPVYNAAGTLATAVRSVQEQSLTDLEIIIIDDASSDDSVRVAERLGNEDPRISLIRRPCNRGQSSARNVGMARARGVWLAPVDADDEISPTRLFDLCEAADTAGADLIADGIWFTGERGPGTPSELSAGKANGSAHHELSIETLITSDIPLNGQCSLGYLKPLMRTDFLRAHDLRYDEELRFAEDLNLYIRALAHGGRFVLHPKSYYLYNQTPVSASRDVRVLPRVAEHALVNNDRLREMVRQHGLHELMPLVDEHRQRWSTVLWFNRLKGAVRDRRLADAMYLTLDFPNSPMGILRFARDRARIKRYQDNPSEL